MRKHVYLGFVLVLTSPVAAHAADYTITIYETPAELAKRTAQNDAGKAYWAAFADYGQALAKAGVLRGGAALAVPANATADTLSGYFIIDVASDADAAAWAAKAPSVAHGGRAIARLHLPMAGK